MSLYFPLPKRTVKTNGVEILTFEITNNYNTQIQLAIIPPGAEIISHNHSEVQIGLCLSGSFLMEVNGNQMILNEMETAYSVAPNEFHSGKNIFSDPAIGLDIKCLNPAVHFPDRGETFLPLVNQRELSTGILMSFFVGPWCEIMLSRIPKGANMPWHHHSNEQIGIAVKGQYMMRVEEEEELFKYGKIYHAPPQSFHSAYNPFEEEAVSLNIFMPPRYNKLPKYSKRKINGGI